MVIEKMITPYNRTRSNNKKNEYIVIHYTGNNGDTAYSNAKYFMRELAPQNKASAHYFVDENKIYQSVEDKDIAWHVGAKKYYNDCRNENSIGIEMCSYRVGYDYFIEQGTKENTIKLTQELMLKYNIKSDKVVRHYDVTRKICPKPFVQNEDQWESFKKEIEWVDALIELKLAGRMTSPEYWLEKSHEISNLRYLFMKWNEDYKK